MKKNQHTSEITNFLQELDESIKPDSESRRAEKEKYAAINEKRDDKNYQEKESKLWKRF